MLKIPKQLQNKNFRFVEIIAGTKRPPNTDWTTSNYKFNDPEFVKHLKTGKAYGVVCGFGNLAIVDCDNEKIAADIIMNLPRTFTVKTGSGGIHVYYIIPDLEKTVTMIDNNSVHHGEVQYTSHQALGANSLHPNGSTYKVLYNDDIQTITKKQLFTVINKYIKSKKFVNNASTGLNIDISLVASRIPGLDSLDGALQGSHPIHGSDGGNNFRIDFDKNVWCCYRCGTGGDAITLIGLLEGIIQCEDCKPGVMKERPEDFKKILKIARDKYKINIPERDNPVQLFTQEGKKQHLNVKGIVEYIKANLTFVVIRDSTGKKPHIYYYEDGYYRLNGDDKIHDIVKRLFGKKWKQHYVSEIMSYVQSGTEHKIDRQSIISPKYLVNLNNGVFDLKTQKLIPHDAKYFFLYKIPIDYNPKAKCEAIQEYFKSTLRPEYITFSQEIFGYCLLNDYPFHSIFYLYGTGGNGKGVWIHLLHSMLGQDNVSTKELSSIVNNRFTTALIYGKLANISGELTNSVLKDTDTLKRLSAGDFIQAEFKNKDGFDFPNKAKIITSCNAIPYCTDMTYGWYDRQFVVPFLKKFRWTKDDNTKLKFQLVENKTEMEGLLLWAIEGLLRILKKESFSYSNEDGEMYLRFQRNASYFVDKHFKKTQNFNDYLSFKDIKDAYQAWCNEYNIPLGTSNALGRQLTYAKFTKDMMYEDRKEVEIRRYIEKV